MKQGLITSSCVCASESFPAHYPTCPHICLSLSHTCPHFRLSHAHVSCQPGASGKPSIKVEELKPKFPSITAGGIVERLKTMCGCVPLPDNPNAFCLGDSVTLMQVRSEAGGRSRHESRPDLIKPLNTLIHSTS